MSSRTKIYRHRRNPRGKTKLEIVLFLANGTRKRQEIINHLGMKFAIQEDRGIDRHLKDLLHDEKIAKEGEGKGLPVNFQLKSTLEGMRRVFSFTRDQEAELDLIKSSYWKKSINDSIFDPLTEEFIKTMRSGGLASASIMRKARNVDLETNLPRLLFPDHERAEILMILKHSPSAISFLLSLSSPGSSMTNPIIEAYLLPYASQVRSLESGKLSNDLTEFILSGFLPILKMDRLRKPEAITPILLVLRSMFITDAFSNRISRDKEINLYLTEILSLASFKKRSSVRPVKPHLSNQKEDCA